MGNFQPMKPLFLFVQLFFFSCSFDKSKEEDVIARVDGEVLTKSGLLFLMESGASNADSFSRTTNNWVQRKLLYRAALSIGLDKDLLLAKERDVFYENLLVSSFISIQTKEKTKTTKKEVSDYYLENKASFKRTDEEVVVKHFVFFTEKKATKVKNQLKKKKPTVDMDELLKKQQVETKTIRKNDAGSNLVGFLFNSGVGSVLGPEKHGEKFHVFQILQKHKKGSYLGLEKVYDEIYHRLYKEKEALILSAVLDSLYLNSDVFVSQEVLSK